MAFMGQILLLCKQGHRAGGGNVPLLDYSVILGSRVLLSHITDWVRSF